MDTVEGVDRWKIDRLKPNGVWAIDVLFCIFYVMEDCGPCYGTWDRNPTVTKIYIRLIEIACEYLNEMKNEKLLTEFLQHILGGEKSKGITYLSAERKKRFAEQLAWLLNLPEYKILLEKYLTPLGARMPNTENVAKNWQEARNEYKKRL